MADVSLERSLRNAEPALRDAFLTMVAAMKGAVNLSSLAVLLQQGRIEEALAEALSAAPMMGRAATGQIIDAANDVAKQIGRSLGQIVIDFDQTNEFAVQAMRNNQLRLIQGFTRQQIEATREALLDGIRRGANPREQALAFRNSIGLTRNQVRAVNNFRRALEEGNLDALTRQLRDRRFDPTIRRAIESGKPLSQRQIDKMVDRYRERWIRHRSQVIARTEALRSVHEGNSLMFRQAIESGQLDPTTIEQEWNTAADERVRGSHSTMHGQTIGVNELFVSGKGNVAPFPGAFGVAEEDIQCRCAVGTRIKSLSIAGNIQAEIL